MGVGGLSVVCFCFTFLLVFCLLLLLFVCLFLFVFKFYCELNRLAGSFAAKLRPANLTAVTRLSHTAAFLAAAGVHRRDCVSSTLVWSVRRSGRSLKNKTGFLLNRRTWNPQGRFKTNCLTHGSIYTDIGPWLHDYCCLSLPVLSRCLTLKGMCFDWGASSFN